MSREAYVNGRYVPVNEAMVHAEDRGFQFADGIYEVCAVIGGRFLDYEGHMARLERSLGEMRIATPMSNAALTVIMREVVRRNRIKDGMVYIQITRGAAPRDHPFPKRPIRPTVVVMAKPVDMAAGDARARKGTRIVTMPDLRWARCDIKSVSLLPNVLSIQHARDSGVDDAWLLDDDGFVREGTRSNAWIITQDGTLVTRHLDTRILGGITRTSVAAIAAELGLAVEERPFSVEEARSAREAFATSASAMVMPIVQIDEAVLGNGEPGSLALRIREAYIAAAIRESVA